MSVFSSDSSSSLFLAVLFSTPFLWNRQWGIAAAVTLAIFLWQSCRWANEIDEKDKWKIRFNILNAEEIVQAMADCETRHHQSGDKEAQDRENAERLSGHRIILEAGLSNLAKKYNSLRSETHSSSSNESPGSEHLRNGLALFCQEAVFLTFRYFVDADSTCMDLCDAGIALLALVAKNEAVRERHLHQADIYGLDLPVKIIREALEVAKDIHGDPAKEQEAAEIQRKSCLLMGALAEGNSELAQLIAGEGGIHAILDAASWYRFHSEVGNWALWALFILCYEYAPNKALFVENDGVPVMIQVLRNCRESTDVVRHGVALLFDLLRKDADAPGLDRRRVRQDALVAGLHDVLPLALEENATSRDIVMMGTELLIGTGYNGEIPVVGRSWKTTESNDRNA